MEGLQHKLMALTQKRTRGNVNMAGDSLNLTSQVIARRTENDGTVKFLVRWHPADVVSDEWISEKEYQPTKLIPIPSLDVSAKATLKPCLHLAKDRSHKHRRKYIRKET